MKRHAGSGKRPARTQQDNPDRAGIKKLTDALDGVPNRQALRPTRRDVIRSSVAAGVAMTGASLAGTVAATEAITGGTVEWTYEADQRARTSPTVVDGVVYIGMSDQPSHRHQTNESITPVS